MTTCPYYELLRLVFGPAPRDERQAASGAANGAEEPGPEEVHLTRKERLDREVRETGRV